MLVFVGYRFPESDSQSRSTLLEAIGENRGPGRILTVLGPSTFDSERLKVLLEVATFGRPHAVRILPLFAQDFLALVWSLNLLENLFGV